MLVNQLPPHALPAVAALLDIPNPRVRPTMEMPSLAEVVGVNPSAPPLTKPLKSQPATFVLVKELVVKAEDPKTKLFAMVCPAPARAVPLVSVTVPVPKAVLLLATMVPSLTTVPPL